MKRSLYLVILALFGTLCFVNGQTSYDFRERPIVDNAGSSDGSLVLSGSYGYHGGTYGLNLKAGGKITIAVEEGVTTLSFLGSVHSSLNLAGIVVAGESLGTQYTKVGTDLVDTYDFVYNGVAATLEFTAELNDAGSGSDVYLPLITVNTVKVEKSTKTDVWDFGAVQLDEEFYNNHLTEDVINAWYPEGSALTGVTFPSSFTAGVLSWTGGGNDRLRTSNENLIRYDAGSGLPATVGGETLTGYLYINASAATGRYFGLTLSADDEVAVYAKSQNGNGQLTFEYMGDNTQKDVQTLSSDVTVFKFVAKKSGSYHIYDSVDKPFYYRILRKDATYATISGSLDVSGANGIPAEYKLVLTNEAGKEFTQTLTSGSTNYSIQVPIGYSYTLGLGNANGYIITNGTDLNVEANATHNIVIEKVALNTLSGSISGLNSELLNKLNLTFTPEDESKIFVPSTVINKENSTYTVELEPNCKYIISTTDVNDYIITNNEVSITADNNFDIVFAAKPTYKIDITANGLNAEQSSKLSVTFENLNETGYSYTFTDLNDVKLRDGVYSISCNGLNEYPLQLAATSNLTVEGTEVSKTLTFEVVNNWSFDDMVITNGTTTAYKGLLFAGNIANEIAKGHLLIKNDATVKVPVNPGEKLIITYYYSAKFTVGDSEEVIETTSGSTSKYESVEYVYSGSTADYVIIKNVSGTTYITDITKTKAVSYSEVITVGTDKTYQTINDALAAIRAMDRPNSERVKIMVDPGNYEEMLVIDMDSVSIVNASANPSIALQNSGVGIDENAVRITGYYGHGYNYFSMGTDQKWSADALRVNKENGYTTYANTGSGTGNGSYWNATVVVSAPGFEASHIIFENSFNQYISKKESEDVVVEWTSGGKGTRPTDAGNTAVQSKSFVERAAAIAYTASADKSILYKCRVIGRQDSFYGAEGARIVAYKGSLMGGTDYLFGGMTLVAYKSDLAMNTSETSTDVAYITAAQQNSARGYLLYNCTVTSAQPGTETASEYLSKPGYFGRPWQANTSEVVFYNTVIKTSNNPSYLNQSLILPVAWLSSLGGESVKSYEYGTIEESGVNNSANRASWSTVLTEPKLTDQTEITTFNFTKGTDDWDPIPALIANDKETSTANVKSKDFSLTQFGNTIKISGISSATNISIYGVDGALNNNFTVDAETQFSLNSGFWIVKALNRTGEAILKTLVP